MSKSHINVNEDFVEMWLDAIQKMRNDIEMEYCDSCYKEDYWTTWTYDPNCPPDFIKDRLWREKPLDENVIFEQWIAACRKIRAGKEMVYRNINDNVWINWTDKNNLPQFYPNIIWKESNNETSFTNTGNLNVLVTDIFNDGAVTIELNFNGVTHNLYLVKSKSVTIDLFQE